MPSERPSPDAQMEAETEAEVQAGNPRPLPRRLYSFVRRGRVTGGQRRALDELGECFGLPPGEQLLDLDQVFERQAPRTLEIGFGNGEVLAALAAAEPEHDFIGIEVHRSGLGQLLSRAGVEGLGNLRVSGEDAVALLEQRFPPACLDRILVFFPDPWPKKRHRKRRIIQPSFTALLASRLRPGGLLYVATDWAEYGDWIRKVLEATPGLINAYGAGQWAPHPVFRPSTRFERRGLRLGHGVRDLVYQAAA